MSELVELPSLPLTELLSPAALTGGGSGGMAGEVYRLLRRLIIEVKLLPGRALSEKEVAAALSVSKTPAREAIIRLAEEGLLTVVPKGGTYVAPIDIQRYMEAVFVRVRLEESAAMEAARRHSFEDLGRLDMCVAMQVEAARSEDFAAFFQLDEDFHRDIFVAARLPGVWTIVNQAKGEVDRMRHLKRVFAVRRTEDVIKEHKAIVDAIRSGDPARAREALVAHLGSLESKLGELSGNPKLWSYIEKINTRSGRKRAPRHAASSTA